MTIFNRAIVTVDGAELQSKEDSVKFIPGHAYGMARKGPRGFVGVGVKVDTSELSCELIPVPEFDPKDLMVGRIVTVRVFDDFAGQEWVIPRMAVTDRTSLSEGDDSSWSFKFEGDEAEKVK